MYFICSSKKMSVPIAILFKVLPISTSVHGRAKTIRFMRREHRHNCQSNFRSAFTMLRYKALKWLSAIQIVLSA